MTINETIRQQVRERANGLCEYCHSPERICTTRFTIDHILPRSLDGSDRLENLAFACRRCNERRYNFIAGFDRVTQRYPEEESIRSARELWRSVGLHPPADDPCQTS